MDLAGIKVKKDDFIIRLRLRFGERPAAKCSGPQLFQVLPRLSCLSQPLILPSCLTPPVFMPAAADKIDLLLPPEPQLMTLGEANSYFAANGLLINKIEFENLFDHFGGGKDNPVADMDAFLMELRKDVGGDMPVFHETHAPPSPHTSHLALSGVSHIEFGLQFKPFPKHWGVPPNAQMKGHDGIMRDLPGGYGKGNAPMYNWVSESLAKDKKSDTNERGVKPYPYGNYSL